MQLDTGAILWSAPERDRAERPLLVLLHGYGSHEGDLFQLGPMLPLDSVIASLRAPLPIGAGYAWFALDGEPGNRAAERVDEAASAVLAWLDTVSSTSVSLLGFSQGAALALQLMRLAPERFRSVVALSGFVAAGSLGGDTDLLETPVPVFWGRGTEDRVITDAAVERTAEWLPSHADATIRIYEGVGHGVTGPEISDVSAFLRAQRG
jgi:phospholipase/carboxylesterase